MNYSEIYNLHMELLKTYASNKKEGYSSNQTEINYYRNQLRFAEDMVQRIFVLNQLVKLHEQDRESMIRWCSEAYFHKNYDVNDSPDGSLG